MPAIISRTKQRNEYNAVSEEHHATGRSVFVTRNDNSDLAIMNTETFERLAANAPSELLVLPAQGHADAEARRTCTATDVIADLRERLLT